MSNIVVCAENGNVKMEADTIQNGRSSKNQMSRWSFKSCVLTLIGIMFFSVGFAQDYMKDPKENERVIENVTLEVGIENRTISDHEVYIRLLNFAKKKYPNKVVDIRNLNYVFTRTERRFSSDLNYYYSSSAKIVEFVSPETKLNETLVRVVDRALSRVNDGSRLAIDQISVTGSGLNRDNVNDQLIDILLAKEYRVVAKQFLERLRDEQREQQSGGFNERTTVRTDNFTAVGYFLNVRVTDEAIRIQAINVSTGEYEGNATVEF